MKKPAGKEMVAGDVTPIAASVLVMMLMLLMMVILLLYFSAEVMGTLCRAIYMIHATKTEVTLPFLFVRLLM